MVKNGQSETFLFYPYAAVLAVSGKKYQRVYNPFQKKDGFFLLLMYLYECERLWWP